MNFVHRNFTEFLLSWIPDKFSCLKIFRDDKVLMASIATFLAMYISFAETAIAADESYEVKLTKHVTLHQEYPKGALIYGIEGDAIIRLRVEKTGKISAFSFIKKPEHPMLVQAVKNMIKASSPAPKPPKKIMGKEKAIDFIFPVAFRLEPKAGSLIAIDREFQKSVKEAWDRE